VRIVRRLQGGVWQGWQSENVWMYGREKNKWQAGAEDQEIYARTRNKVKVGEKEGEWFETTKGVRQGCHDIPDVLWKTFGANFLNFYPILINDMSNKIVLNGLQFELIQYLFLSSVFDKW
jgi:hypothetical protein